MHEYFGGYGESRNIYSAAFCKKGCAQRNLGPAGDDLMCMSIRQVMIKYTCHQQQANMVWPG
jgi:hypothetical protein